MFVSPIRFGSVSSTVAEMQATSGAIDSQAALMNNAMAQQALLRNADQMRMKDVFEKDKKLALERVQKQTELKLYEAQKQALEEKRKKEAAKK